MTPAAQAHQALAPAPARRVLGDVVPRTRLRDLALVTGGTAWVAAASQPSIPLWFTPVPLTLGSFAALLAGAALGPIRAAMSMGLFLAIGMAGAPVFADQSSGYLFASFGYAAGYLPAATLVGWLARRGHDRAPHKLFAGICLASVLIYAGGLPWFIIRTGIDLETGIAHGVVPFIPGDVIKAIATAALLPIAWRVINHRHR